MLVPQNLCVHWVGIEEEGDKQLAKAGCQLPLRGHPETEVPLCITLQSASLCRRPWASQASFNRS